MLTRKDIRDIYKHVQDHYKDNGYDVSDVKLQISKIPVNNKGGRVSPLFNRDTFGGCWTSKKFVRVNPEYQKPMNYFGAYKGTDEQFLTRIIGHELAHEIDANHLTAEARKKLLRKIRAKKFATDYLKSVRKNKYDSEAIAEWMSSQVPLWSRNKQA